MKKLIPFLVLFVTNLSITNFSFADTPGAHPAYLHALTDLRGARAHLDNRGGSAKLQREDGIAVKEIDACIEEIKKASIDDGKNLNDHPGEDAGADRVGDVHRARQLLDNTKKDISGKEDDKFARGLKKRALHHLDEALHHIDEAIRIGK